MNYCLNTKASDDVCLSTPEIKSGKPEGCILFTSGIKSRKNQRKSMILDQKEDAAYAD
jgi:hypothetical protein